MKSRGDNGEHPCKDQRTDEDLEKWGLGPLGGVEKPHGESNARTNKRKNNAQRLRAEHCYTREDVLSELRYHWSDEERNEIRRSASLQD